MNPIRAYVDWARANPQKAQSLENMSRVFCLMRADVFDITSAEKWWMIAKVHSFVNKTIIDSKNKPFTSSINAALSPIVGLMKLVECVIELTCRSKFGHKVTWDMLVAWQAVKSGLLLVVNRNHFTLPCMWSSIVALFQRTLGFETRPERKMLTCEDAVLDKNKASSLSTTNVSESPTYLAPLVTSPSMQYPTVKPNSAALPFGESAENTADDGAPLPSPSFIVVPRVISSKLATHRHNGALVTSESTTGVSTTTQSCKPENTIRDAERFPMTWIDVLGMMLDAYRLLRPLLLVGCARFHHFGSKKSSTNSLLPMLPEEFIEKMKKTFTPSSRSSASPKSSKEKKTEEHSAIDHNLAIAQGIASIPCERGLFPNWKYWIVFTLLDAVSTILSRFVRARRVPAVYIADDSDAVQGTPATDSDSDSGENESTADGEEEGRESRQGASEAADQGTAKTSAVTSEPLSQDERRVVQSAKSLFLSALRDPFFGVALKQWIVSTLMGRIFRRIPLFGAVINYQMTCYLMMQQFSFMYTLDS